MDFNLVSPGTGGRPRPSRTWHAEHETRLKSGPSPSSDLTEAGAVTQLVVNILSPNAKSRSFSMGRLASDLLKACRDVTKTVVSPPERAAGLCLLEEGLGPAAWRLR